jgi:hypothetical protein
LKTFVLRLVNAYADQGPGPTLTVLMALMAAIGQAELSFHPPHGPTIQARHASPPQPSAGVEAIRAAAAESATVPVAP